MWQRMQCRQESLLKIRPQCTRCYFCIPLFPSCLSACCLPSLCHTDFPSPCHMPYGQEPAPGKSKVNSPGRGSVGVVHFSSLLPFTSVSTSHHYHSDLCTSLHPQAYSSCRPPLLEVSWPHSLRSTWAASTDFATGQDGELAEEGKEMSSRRRQYMIVQGTQVLMLLQQEPTMSSWSETADAAGERGRC
jgi:hypothetical protein